MLPHTDASRRRAIELRILNEVNRYHAQHGEGMAMQILSAKYARALRDLGGFSEVVYALETSGSIAVDVSLTGRRTVKPKGIEVAQSGKAWF